MERKEMKYMIKIMPVLFLALMLAGPVSVAAAQKENGIETDLEDGEYSIQVDLEGGSGKASVSSPTLMLVKNGRMYAELQWSSSNYDYMIVDGEKYEPVNKDGNSTFEIPVTVFDTEMEVTADTVAMSTPHEIDYTLNFDSSSMKKAEK